MARYVNADKFIAELEQEKTAALEFGDGVAAYEIEHTMNLISMQPTADVVPKSEVERLQEALSKAEADVKNYMKVAEYQQSLSIKRYHEIKRLKEDIERLEDINERDVENIRLAKTEVAREIFEEIDGITELFAKGLIEELEMYDKLAELKKKYSEAKK